MCSSHRGSLCVAVRWAHLLTSTSHPPALQVRQVLRGQGHRGFLLVVLPSPFSNKHVPKSQPIPPQTSPDLEHLPGEGTEGTAHFCKDFLPFFWPCLPHLMLLSLDYFLSCFLSFSPCSLGFLPLALFLPLLSLLHTVWPTAVSTCSFPGVSRDDMDCVLVLSSAFIREGEEKEEEKASTPWKLARRQYSGRVTLLLLSLHAALQFAWRRDYLGCSKGTLLPGSQHFGRANLASLLLP